MLQVPPLAIWLDVHVVHRELEKNVPAGQRVPAPVLYVTYVEQDEPVHTLVSSRRRPLLVLVFVPPPTPSAAIAVALASAPSESVLPSSTSVGTAADVV